jgi:hypothetical protein
VAQTSSGRKTKHEKLRILRKEDLNAACKDKSTTIKFLKDKLYKPIK